jgi:predicted ATP-grasp superfamily ATP-dependent carboligase
MIQNKIFIFEFVSGGGFNTVEIPPSLFCEGFAMLRSIISDFKKTGFEISSLLDHRIHYLSPYLRADSIDLINTNDDFITKFKEKLKDSKFCFVIAPEFSNILYNLTQIAVKMNKVILSTNLEAIKLASSKLLTYNYFKTHSILTPRTYLIPYKKNNLDIEFITKKINKLKQPIIIKPVDGVGAESIYYFENKMQIFNFFKNNKQNLDLTRKFILQEYISGEDLSISLINHHNSNPIILSVNSQQVILKNDDDGSQYYGGYTPVDFFSSIKKTLNSCLKRLDLTDFSGFFGIDFIKVNSNFNYFIEINPRLTTSYIGLRNIIKQNPVDLLFNLDRNSLDINDLDHINFSKFCRLELIRSNHSNNMNPLDKVILRLIKNNPELITPPIAFKNLSDQESKRYSCFIATKTKDKITSDNKIRQIKESLKKSGFKVLN